MIDKLALRLAGGKVLLHVPVTARMPPIVWANFLSASFFFFLFFFLCVCVCFIIIIII